MATKKRKVAKRKPTVKRKRSVVKKRIYKPKIKKMAKKKTKTTTRRRRRSSISGMGGEMGNIVPVVIGAVAGKILSAKLSAKMNPKILAAVQLGAGFFLPKMVKNNKMVAGIGTGLMVSGALSGLQSFGVLSGIAGMVGADDMQMEMLSGTDNLSALAGEDDGFGLIDEGTMSGTDSLSEIAGGVGAWEDQISAYDADDSMGDYED